jgi:FAD/FMN-containing dehydrogenase
VAGYDYGKLLVGSWGTLGVITELTCRLLPLPKARGAMIAAFETCDAACSAASDIVVSRLNPSVVTLVNARVATLLAGNAGVSLPPKSVALVVGAEGFGPAVARQVHEFGRMCGEHGGQIAGGIGDEEYDPLVALLIRLCSAREESEPVMSLRIGTAPGDMAEAIGAAEACETDGTLHAFIVAHLAGGSAYAQFVTTGVRDARHSAEAILRTITDSPSRNSITVLRVCPDAAPHVPFITGNRPPASSWLRAIKNCFDPDELMNPGIPQWWTNPIEK